MLAELAPRTRCRECDRPAAEGVHKTDPILECPDCGAILVRF